MFFVVKRNFYGRGIFSAFLLRAALLIMRSFMMFGLICAAERLLGAAGRLFGAAERFIWCGGETAGGNRQRRQGLWRQIRRSTTGYPH